MMRTVSLLIALLSLFVHGVSTLTPTAFAAVFPSAFPEAFAQTVDGARIDSLFAHFSESTPGAAVAVVRNGEAVFLGGYGMADLEHGIPVTASTVFDIASVSKQFAGFAVATLEEQGLIDLEANVSEYLPEIPDFDMPVAVHHLVHHTSGIRDWPATLAAGGWRMDDVISFEQILRMAWNQRELNFEPGSEYSYSNTGYNLLAEIVARVSGMSFRRWSDEHIFAPLAMENSHVHDDHTEIVAGRAYGYQYGAGGYYTAFNGLTALGSSSVFSSAKDMAAWLINFDRRDVGGNAVIEKMRTRTPLSDAAENAYAYGISRGDYRGLGTWSHSGSWAGFRSYLLHFPDEQFGVVILSNLGSFNPSTRAYSIADLYLENRFAPSAGEPTAQDRESMVVDEQLLEDYAGTYRLDAGWYVEITRGSDGLHVQATGESRYPMTAVSETEFWVDAYGASIHFERNAEGLVDRVRYRTFTAPRVAPFDPSNIDPTEYTGTYYSDELSTQYDITVRDGSLEATHFRHGTFTLTPAQRDEFASSLWFFSPVTFIRNESDVVTAMLVGRGRARNLRFRRLGPTTPSVDSGPD